MALVGADLDQMHALARSLEQAADRLDAASGTVTGMLSSVPWSGPDSERYRSQWHGESRPAMRAAADTLREAAHLVTRNAAEQQQASAAAGGGSGSGAGGAFAGTSPSGPFSPMPSGSASPPLNPLTGIRDFLNSNMAWPITWGTALGPADKLGVLPLLDALGLANDSRLSDQEKIISAGNSFTDLAGGLIKGKGGPVGYLGGVAIQQWGDVAANAARADFSAAGVQTVTDYIAKDPGGAFNAAKDAVVGYIPKLFSNLLP
jgi:uncharacterized protein YukE